MAAKQTAFKSTVRLLVMPDDGAEAVRRLIDGAERSLLIKMFEFDAAALIAALIAARARGVDVDVLLNPVRSNGSRPNDPTFAAFREAGITVGWTSPRFKITHEKSMIVDGRTALISTFNFSDKHLTRTRDYGVLVEDAAVVAEIAACFEADRDGRAFAPPSESPLAWSNVSARRAVADFIDAAERQLHIQHPKLNDSAIVDRILAARARDVTVHLLCGGAHGIEDYNLVETFSHQRTLARAGVHLRKQHGLKLHAKMLLADGKRAMVGSMNIDRDAFDVRRELGIVLAHAHAVKALGARFDADWHAAKRYDAPDPLSVDVETTIAAEAADDGIGLMHE